ncbi:MAG: hypothetical protein JXX29_21030 [Deltaproteobacteria bacterium]|nr:hypothetical protein [Deltaproteobacteria bacterium]MBN2674179.1 hypothetical protein [Deltaproteobacteria bacterium]
MRVLVEPELQSKVRIAALLFHSLSRCDDDGDEIWRQLSSLGDEIRTAYAGVPISQIEGIQNARALYRSIGVDPTKNRPSSEALLRRCIKGKGLYRVHPLVDALNLVSLRFLLPVGLYDRSKIIGDDVRITIGDRDWGYEGIRKGRVNVEERMCIADSAGPFGSPTSDSRRTSIEGHAREILITLYQYPDGDAAHLEDARQFTQTLIQSHFHGQSVFPTIL